MTRILFQRRSLLQAVAAAGASAGLPISHGVASQAISNADLERFNPFGTVKDYFEFMRPLLFDIKRGRPYLDAMWRRYKQTGERFDGERALMGLFIMWRAIPTNRERVKFAVAGQRMAADLAQHFSNHPSGHVWGAIFYGSEALAAGVLESVHLAPDIENRLKIASKLDESYLYGLPAMVRAKLFLKAPPFPVSVGSYDKAMQYLEHSRQYSEGKFAAWYIIKAEAEYLLNGKQKAFDVLDRMEKEVKMTNVAEAYALDAMIYDAKLFRDAVNSGEYNKYFWDTFMMLSKPGMP